MTMYNPSIGDRILELEKDPEGYSKERIAQILLEERFVDKLPSVPSIYNWLNRAKEEKSFSGQVDDDYSFNSDSSDIGDMFDEHKRFDWFTSKINSIISDNEEHLTMLVISDTHFPFHDPQSIRMTLKIIERTRPTLVIINGDLLDNAAISRFASSVSDLIRDDFGHSLNLFVKFVKEIQELGSTVVAVGGNHDIRLIEHLQSKSPSMFNFTMQNTYRAIDESGCIFSGFTYDGFALGKVVGILHGYLGRMHTASAMLDAFPRYDLIISGHTHRGQTYTKSTRDLSTQRPYDRMSIVLGCQCLEPHYKRSRSQPSKWNMSAALVTYNSLAEKAQAVNIDYNKNNDTYTAQVNGEILVVEYDEGWEPQGYD